MKKSQLKEIIKTVVKEVLNTNLLSKEKIQFHMDPDNKGSLTVYYLGRPVGMLMPEHPHGIDPKFIGGYSELDDTSDPKEMFIFHALDARFSPLKDRKANLRKHKADLQRLVAIRIEKTV